MGICYKINTCLSYCLILFAACWFVFVVVINNNSQDPRFRALQLLDDNLSQGFQKEMYLRKIDLPQNHKTLQNFELIQIMNDSSPNIIGNDAILIISITNVATDHSYLRFVQYFYKNKEGTDQNKMPVYILRQTRPVLLTNDKYIQKYRSQIQQTLNYFVRILNIKKLSILSFQIGALLTLYTLSMEVKSNIFSSIQKVVLINPFCPYIRVYNSPPISFVQSIKARIIQNNQTFFYFNQLRLIIISTTRTVFLQSPIAEQYFSFSAKIPNENQLYKFNQTVIISSRAMWNVFCFLNQDHYFRFQPFVWLLSKFFIQDQKQILSTKQILYFLHYKETPQVKQLSERTKKKYINRCKDFHLQNYQYNGNVFTEECVRLLRKQNIYFSKSSIILYSQYKFQVFGQNFQKLYPFESKTSYMIYHIENMNSFSRLFIINRNLKDIHLTISPVFTPFDNPIVSMQGQNGDHYGQIGFQNLSHFSIVRTCQPANLVFPIHFGRMARFGHGLLFSKQKNKNCYIQYDNYDYYPDWFLLNWNIFRNIMIISMFCSHILGKPAISRFYTQVFINQVLVYAAFGSFLTFQNFIILSTISIVQVILQIIVWISEYISIPRNFSLKMLWMPIAFQLIRHLQPQGYPNPNAWKVISIQLALTVHKKNILITCIKLAFLLQYIVFDQGNLNGIILLCAWQLISTPKDDQQAFSESHLLKIKVVNYLFLFLLAFCIRQDGIVIDQIVNFYIIVHGLLIMHKYLSKK